VTAIKNLAAHYTRPDWVRRLIAMGDSVGGAERLVPLDADALVATAIRSTGGLADFGDFDGDWRARFDALVAEIEATGRLHALGRLMTRQELLRGLRTRLLVARARSDAPAIASERIEAPIVITGPPRSGTSILFELLALDPRARAPVAWEAIHPVPFDGRGDAEARRALAECEQEFWADVQPEFAAIHELRADLPVECVTITLPGFSGGHWPMIANIPGWQPDWVATMRYHRALLQTLQHGGPPRTWVLKTPVYLVFIDLLFATYPDAWVVHTHRDPIKTEPSSLSTLATVRWERSDAAELPEAGAGLGDVMLALARRRAAGELPPRIVDSHFADLLRDPVAAVASLYAEMRRPFLGAHADAIRRYVAAKPRGKFGVHRYAPEEWGFDPVALRERMRPYTDYYGVALEE
jgi:hypothetical protein